MTFMHKVIEDSRRKLRQANILLALVNEPIHITCTLLLLCHFRLPLLQL